MGRIKEKPLEPWFRRDPKELKNDFRLTQAPLKKGGDPY